MACRHWRRAWAWSLAMAVLAVHGANAGTPESNEPLVFPVRTAASPAFGMPAVPFELLQPGVREAVHRVLTAPTLSTQGSAEVFLCNPLMYQWLLEHPDLAIPLWKQLGARVTEIENRGNGRYGYRDEHGSDIHWDMVVRAPGVRVWYAEGYIKPALLVPKAHVEVVVVLHYREVGQENGRTALRHQVHAAVKTDSRTLSLAARVMGGSAPKMAEQYMGQLQMFYGAMAWYLDQNAERARKMFQVARISPAPGTLVERKAEGVKRKVE
jgi:hypothetical protein